MTARPVLRRGDFGEWVLRLQEALLEAGFDPGILDSDFGSRTEQAVLAFQEASGLEADGVVGPMTWDVLEVSEDVDPDAFPDDAGGDETGGDTSVDWSTVDGDERMRYVMVSLVEEHGYPMNGAAGVVGNLWAESGLLPNRIEGSSSASPMRARDFSGTTVDFTPGEIRDRDRSTQLGPALPGVGLAQWTSPHRRSGLFQHSYQGRVLGDEILFDMDAQVDYLVAEMRSGYLGVHGVVTDPDVSVDDASDEVVYNFEVPGSVLEGGTKLPRTDPRVQGTFQARRAHSHRALRSYEPGQ